MLPLLGLGVLKFLAPMALSGVMWSSAAQTPPAATGELLVRQTADFEIDAPKGVIELQPFRVSTHLSITDASGRQGVATLVNLNPHVNAWFVLSLLWPNEAPLQYHLTNLNPWGQSLTLDPDFADGLQLVEGKERYACALWGADAPEALVLARRQRVPNAVLCEGRLFLRNSTEGHKSSKEWAADFLRTYVPGGEQITSLVRDTLYQDAYRTTSELVASASSSASETAATPGVPTSALVNPSYQEQFLIPAELGIAIDYETPERMQVGRWYPVTGMPGIFLSAIQPKLVAEEVIAAQSGKVKALDEVEATSLVFLVAFDLQHFEMGFMLGTEHPRVGWSDLVSVARRTPGLPGPDGIDDVTPLVRTGILSGVDPKRVAATFVGGFKRYHGAMRKGDLAGVNHSSHYGFMEEGVVISKLQPGLATVLIYVDGEVELKTWTGSTAQDLVRVRYARQNGVPVIEFDPVSGSSAPGAFVAQSQLGNWSASHDKRYRTVRSGVCSQFVDDNRFLIYGYFSSATPSALARVFQAYQCRYAMMLDINALEHTYLAVYGASEDRFEVQNLIKGMGELDKVVGDKIIPRFVGYADNRDFFYFLRKTP